MNSIMLPVGFGGRVVCGVRLVTDHKAFSACVGDADGVSIVAQMSQADVMRMAVNPKIFPFVPHNYSNTCRKYGYKETLH